MNIKNSTKTAQHDKQVPGETKKGGERRAGALAAGW